jgi:hypothetical protein
LVAKERRMPLSTICPACQQRLKVPDHLAGKQVRCPKCKQIMQVQMAQPAPPVQAAPRTAQDDHLDRKTTNRGFDLPTQRSFETSPPTLTSPAKRRSKKKRNRSASNKTLYWVLGLAGGGFVVTLILCSAALWWSLSMSSNAPKPNPQPQLQVQPRVGNFAASSRHVGPGRRYWPEHGFSMAPPRMWLPLYDQSGAVTGYQASKEGLKAAELQGIEDTFDPNFNLQVNRDDGTPLEAVPDQIKVAMPKQFKDWQVLDEGFVKIDGKKAYRIASSFVVAGKGQNTEIHMVQYFVLSNNKAYALTFGAGPQSFPHLRETFEQAALSARFN